MTRKAISSKSGVAVGPYSHAIDADGFIFLSGQTPIDPASGKLVSGSITEETKQCLTNLGAVLEAANLTFENVIKCNVFLTTSWPITNMPGTGFIWNTGVNIPF